MIVKIAVFRNNMAHYLEHLEEDIYLTRHGKVIGVVSAPNKRSEAIPPDEMDICLHEIKAQLKHLGDLLQTME